MFSSTDPTFPAPASMSQIPLETLNTPTPSNSDQASGKGGRPYLPADTAPCPAHIVCDDVLQACEAPSGSTIPSLPTGKRWLGVLSLQQEDNGHRMMQVFPGLTCLIIAHIDREVWSLVHKISQGIFNGVNDVSPSFQKAKQLLLEKQRLAESLVMTESLSIPGDLEVELMRYVLPRESLRVNDGPYIEPPSSPVHWRYLRKTNTQERLAQRIPLLKFFRKHLTRFFQSRHHADDPHSPVERYDLKRIDNAILYGITFVSGFILVVVVDLLALKPFATGILIGILDACIMLYGLFATWWLEDSALALVVMFALASVFVNVSV